MASGRIPLSGGLTASTCPAASAPKMLTIGLRSPNLPTPNSARTVRSVCPTARTARRGSPAGIDGSRAAEGSAGAGWKRMALVRRARHLARLKGGYSSRSRSR